MIRMNERPAPHGGRSFCWLHVRTRSFLLVFMLGLGGLGLSVALFRANPPLFCKSPTLFRDFRWNGTWSRGFSSQSALILQIANHGEGRGWLAIPGKECNWLQTVFPSPHGRGGADKKIATRRKTGRMATILRSFSGIEASARFARRGARLVKPGASAKGPG